MSNAEPNNSDNGAGTKPAPSGGKKRRPTRYLPTPRISFEKQVDLLRAFGVLYSANEQPVTNEDAGPAASLAASTAQLTNAFFVENGLLERSEAGAFTPHQVVRDFAQAYEWNPETAGEKLSPKMRETWFAKTLLPRLSMSPQAKAQALQVMAEACGASTDFADQVELLLSYLEFAGVVTVEDGVVATTPRKGIGAPSHSQEPEAEREDDKDDVPANQVSPKMPSPGENADRTRIIISIPDKGHAEFFLPSDFDAEDYHMVRVQLDAYMKRKFGWKAEDEGGVVKTV